MKVYIKNMVCDRCIIVVRQVLDAQHLHPSSIRLGEVELAETELKQDALGRLAEGLGRVGFELMDDKKSRIIEKIKNAIIRLVHYTGEPPRLKYSEIIADQVGYDYPYLSKLFSEVEGVTVEQYLIRQRVEKAKEYLVYDELSLSEIADKMGYSSVAHLSGQFRKLTGMTPTAFKKLGTHPRLPLDYLGTNAP
jgi:AraC-like DNA-binding protein